MPLPCAGIAQPRDRPPREYFTAQAGAIPVFLLPRTIAMRYAKLDVEFIEGLMEKGVLGN